MIVICSILHSCLNFLLLYFSYYRLDLADFPDISSTLANTKLVTLQATTAPTSTAPMTGHSSLSSSGLLVKPTVTLSIDGYAEMAVKSVQRVLESFHEVKNCGTKAATAHMKLTARMVISMTLTDIAEGRQPPVRVTTVASLSPAATGTLLDDVSMDVTMPRILWLVFSYCLSPISSKTSTLVRSQKIEGLPAEKVELITLLLLELHQRLVLLDEVLKPQTVNVLEGQESLPQMSESENQSLIDVAITNPDALTMKENPIRTLYASACVSVISRALQSMVLRPAAKEVALGLPTVPQNVLALLKLLVYTGTRAAAVPPTTSSSASRR